MFESLALMMAAIVALGFAAQWAAWWMKLPAILPLLLIGIALGPLAGILNPDQVFGDLLFPAVSLGVAIILFEGGLTLRVEEIKGHGRVVTRLITLGVLVTSVTIAAATHWLIGLDWQMSFLFGALVSVTGPTVIVPMLRTVKPTENVSNILRWEAILIDPLGALIAVLIYEFIASGAAASGLAALGLFAEIIIVGVVAGAAGAYALAYPLKRHWLPDYLHDMAALGTVLLIFTLSNSVAHESGLLAVTVMGMLLANMKDVQTDDILDFKESLSVLLISALFIVLAARLDVAMIGGLGWPLLGVLAVVLFVARPLSIALSTVGSKLNWRERTLLAWIAPRGIVAAAVSALFALQLDAAGTVGASLLVPLTFSVIIVTVVAQSLTARPFARALGVAEPEARGILIVGGNPAALAIAISLKKLNLPVIVADTSWEQIRKARMAGLRTYFGNVVSDHADRHLDLVGIGQLLALSRRPALNSLACLRYRSEFDSGHVYSVRFEEENSKSEAMTTGAALRGLDLFAQGVTLQKLEQTFADGHEIKVTGLTDEFTYQDLIAQQNGQGILLYAISPEGIVFPFSPDNKFRAVDGWRIASLVKPAPPEAPEDGTAGLNRTGDLLIHNQAL